MGYICQKNIPSVKTLYKEDLSNITFNYLCENSPNSLYHFSNQKSFFMTQLVCIILAETFEILKLKFIKFLMSFLKPRASFSSNFASLSTVMRDNSSVLFHPKLYMLSTNGTHQVHIFSQLLALKLTKFLVIFQATSQFSLKSCIIFQCHDI